MACCCMFEGQTAQMNHGLVWDSKRGHAGKLCTPLVQRVKRTNKTNGFETPSVLVQTTITWGQNSWGLIYNIMSAWKIWICLCPHINFFVETESAVRMYSPYFTQVKSQPVLTSECVKYQSLVKFDDVVTLVTSVLEAVECSSITSG